MFRLYDDRGEMIMAHWCIMNTCWILQNTGFDDITFNFFWIFNHIKIIVDSDSAIIFAWEFYAGVSIYRNVVKKISSVPIPGILSVDLMIGKYDLNLKFLTNKLHV